MRTLQLNPQKHDITLILLDMDSDIAHVDMKLGDEVKGSFCGNANELEKISKWFAAAAKEARKNRAKELAQEKKEGKDGS